MSARARIVLVGGILALLAAGGADAQGLAYAVVNGPYVDAELYRLSLETGELTPVGPIGRAVTHIAFDSEGLLYGIDSENAELLIIDVSDGSGVPVGLLGVEVTGVAGLTFDADNRLWMTAWDDALGPSLYEVDPGTGVATRRAAIGEAHFGSIAASGDGVFIASNSLAVIDTSTGSVVPLPSSNFGIWWSRALDFDGSGQLWSLMLCGPCSPPFDVLVMLVIDHSTGSISSDGLGEPHGTWGLAIFHDGVFVDGFESGDSSSWSDFVAGPLEYQQHHYLSW